jgi:hypothetical protein
MSNRAELPPAVTAFVDEHIETLEHLEVLMLLMKSPDRWWDAAAVAENTGIAASVAGAALERLASRNLLAITITSDVRYRFQPGTPALQEASEQFGEVCRTNAGALFRVVAEGQRRAIRDFADAFRVRRHDDR